jgi:hypothetical protein
MRLLSYEEFVGAKKWYAVIELSGLPQTWEQYESKYGGVLDLTGPNYRDYVKLFQYESTKLGRILHGVD